MTILINQSEIKTLIENELITNVNLKSEHPNDPIVVRNIPDGWKCIGSGNYAAVFMHHSEPNVVVKVYGKDLHGLEKEVQVYKQLGEHPAYSKLILYGEKYLVLKRLAGITLYDAVAKGERIPESVIKDINIALKYARNRGLNPYDVHGKNVMMKDGRGYVVDISDFYKKGKDDKWDDLVKAYYKLYKKTLYKVPIKVPLKLLDFTRHSYRFYKKFKRMI
ncbi:serine/threonine protein kinase [Bacillus sp. AFS002410]|uniref:serine/threonine protein kinase n=1 Tax=Bacillus sp. AFS002410 TaxID=2033481 RepID=UPI000BF244B3|nr:serine/threonine protein kinase [Bacillus sp. AFS002410]PEJ46696.1 serine/threonine protein kinase [Bacillus sp. AFS002410]